ncbi:MAG: hypothetical protein ACFFDN_06890 [Candidatus Hodarchaeota archaeon]
MKEIKIFINDSCGYCKKALKYFNSLHKRKKGAYMHYTKDFEIINGISITPDYNSEGHLTHFHIHETTKEFLEHCLKHIEIMKKESKMIKKLRKKNEQKNK